MGFATLFFACLFISGSLQASEDVEFKDPHLIEIATFAANNLLKDAKEIGINNNSTLLRIMDAQIVPYSQPVPSRYMLTLELGSNCSGDGTCKGGRQICQATVLDESWAKKQTLKKDKSHCADREPNAPLEFIDSFSAIASSLPANDTAVKTIAAKAVTQMGERRGGKHSLKHIGQVRKVMMEESNSNLYYLSLYISTANDDTTTEVCEVTMEESLPSLEQTMQLFRCFATEANDNKRGIVRVPPEDLTQSVIRDAILASLAIIDAESTSQFQLKVVGYALADSRFSVDSGTRDLDMKLGLVPSLCLKSSEIADEDEETESCTIDIEREPSMCTITRTQWPWVTDGSLFSDLECEKTTYAVIGEELEAYTDDDASSGEEEAVEEVTSNAVQNGNRRENVQADEEADDSEGEEVEEEAIVARSGPCYGCPAGLNVNSPAVKDLATFALASLEDAANTEKVQSVARVIKATSQVVSGSVYSLTIELVDTNCLRSENKERSKCQADGSNGSRRICTVQIWDQPWLNSKQVRDPDCDTSSSDGDARSPKTTTGGPRETITLSPDDEEVKSAANFALVRLDAFDDNNKKRILIKVLEAFSHSVARSKTFNMKIQVALTECPESNSPNDPECEANLARSSAYFCDVQVLAQAGADRAFVPKRLVDSKCFPAAPSKDEELKDLTEEESINKQVSGQQLHGGISAANPESPYIQSIAQFATTTVNQRSNSDSRLKLIRVAKADTQVVAGKKIILDIEVGMTNCTKASINSAAGGHCHIDNTQDSIMCRVTVWDRAWLNDRRVTDLTCGPQLSLSPPLPQDNAARIPDEDLDGAPVSEDPMSTEIEIYADFALAVIEEQTNTDDKLKISRILASSVQITEGKTIRLTLEIAPTTCKKELRSLDCPIDPTKDYQICNIQIWDRPEQHEKQVADLSCNPKRVRVTRSEDFDESPFDGDTPRNFRLGGELMLPTKLWRSNNDDQQTVPLIGGYSPADVNDDRVKDISVFATQYVSQSLNGASANAEPYTLVKIHSAYTQVVAGLNYKLELEVGRSDGSVLCNVIVWDQPWTSLRQVTNVTCFPQVLPSANSAKEVFRPVELSDDAVKKAANLATSKLTDSSPNAPFTLVKVNSAARQISNDQTTYKLRLQLLQSGGTVMCEVSVSDSSLTSSSCAGLKKQRQLSGGYSRADVDDHKVQEIAAFATSVISQSSNEKDLDLVRIVSASRQVVSGTNYKLELKLKSSSGTQTCYVVVHDQSWTKTRKLSSFDCKNPAGARTNRQLPRPKTRPSGRPVQPTISIQPSNSELSIEPPAHCAAGGYCPIDPNEKAVKEMAAFATSTLSQTSNARPLKLSKVKSAARQVIAGFNYKLELDFNDGALICNVVVFDRAWTSTREISSSDCKSADPDSAVVGKSKPENAVPVNSAAIGKPKLEEVAPLNKPKPEELAPVNKPIRGGYRTADPNEPTIQQMAQFAATTIGESSNSGPLSLLKVVKAATQVVSGVNYKLTIQLSGAGSTQTCEVIVYDQNWTKTRKLSKSDCSPPAVAADNAPPAVTDEKSPPIVTAEKAPAVVPVSIELEDPKPIISKPVLTGAYQEADPENEVIQTMAQFATEAISESSNSGPMSLLKVIKAATQVVSGVNYKLTIHLRGAETTQTCEVVVYDQKWTNTRRLASVDCTPQAIPTVEIDEPKPQLTLTKPVKTGGYKPADPNNEEIQKMAEFAATSISQKSNSGPLSLVKVVEAATQVVSGVNYKLKIELSGAEDTLTCEVVVYDQSWTGTRELSSSNCDPESENSTEDTTVPSPLEVGGLNEPAAEIPAPGSFVPIDPNSEAVLEMAKFAATTISQMSNSPPLPLLKVIEASTQVVSGTNYKMKIQLGGADTKETCDVVVLDQSWTKTRRLLTSNCIRDPHDSTEEELAVTQKGAYARVDPNDPEINEVALFVIPLLRISMNFNELDLVRVASASKQVVSGVNYKLDLELSASDGPLSCEVVIFQSESNSRHLAFSQCDTLKQSRRPKRSSDHPTGAASPMDLNGEKVKQLTDFAVSTISLRSNEPNTPDAIHVLKASQQTVSGMKYTLELELGFTDCPQDVDACTRRQKCVVAIWEQPWIQKREVTQLSCKDAGKKKKAHRLGGVNRADPASEEIRSQAVFALQAIQAQANSPNRLGVVRIKNAATQIVSGKKVFLTIEVGQCKANNTECSFDDQADRQLCKVVIWNRPWLNENQVTDLKCAPISVAKACNGKSCPLSRVQRSVTEEESGTTTRRPHHHHHHHLHHKSHSLKKSRRMKHMTAFRSFTNKFKKVYATWEEFENRYKIYRANQEKIELLNRYEMGSAVYGDTPFSDLSAAEYKQHLAGMRPLLRHSDSPTLPPAEIPQMSLPDEFDWRHYNVVTPVKNQGSCGSCWAFSVTGNVEGLYGVKHGQLLSLSEQELVDCDKLDSGCNGGLPENAYKAIQEIGGLETETDYPYNGHQDKCHFNANITKVQVTGGVKLPTDETEMAKWLVQNGPISIGINANAMQFYRGGVSHPWKVLCRAGGIDHGVLIVGYGVSDYPKFNKTLPYWIVKNSWGTSWGEQGYYRVFRGDGTCGLNQMATSAVVD